MTISDRAKPGFRLLLGLALLVATWFALDPDPVALPEGAQMDKWAHLLTYLVLAFLVDASWPETDFDLPKWTSLLSYGVAIELIQNQIPNRMLSVGDLVANAAGIALYAFLILRVLRSLGLRQPHSL
jgi:VanZ family protein